MLHNLVEYRLELQAQTTGWCLKQNVVQSEIMYCMALKNALGCINYVPCVNFRTTRFYENTDHLMSKGVPFCASVSLSSHK